MRPSACRDSWARQLPLSFVDSQVLKSSSRKVIRKGSTSLLFPRRACLPSMENLYSLSHSLTDVAAREHSSTLDLTFEIVILLDASSLALTRSLDSIALSVIACATREFMEQMSRHGSIHKYQSSPIGSRLLHHPLMLSFDFSHTSLK